MSATVASPASTAVATLPAPDEALPPRADTEAPSRFYQPLPEGEAPGDEWNLKVGHGGAAVSWPKLFGVVALAVAVLAGGFAFVAAKGKERGNAIAFSFTEGQKIRYRVRGELNATVRFGQVSQPIRENVLAVVTLKVVGVDASGVATIQSTIQPVTQRVNGRAVKAGKAIRDQIRIAADGSVLTTNDAGLGNLGGSGSVFVGLNQMTPILSSRSVNPGDTWRRVFEQQIPFADKPLRVEAQSTLVQNDTVGGKSRAVITTNVTMPLDFSIPAKRLLDQADPSIRALAGKENGTFVFGGKITSYQTSWLDPAEGQLLQSSIFGQIDVSLKATGFTDLPADGSLDSSLSGTISLQLARLLPRSAKAGQSADADAEDRLRAGLSAANVFFTAAETYRGLNKDNASILEPSLRWRVGGAPQAGAVTIRQRTDAAVLLVTKSSDGSRFCIAHTLTGTFFGTTAPATADDCRGGW